MSNKLFISMGFIFFYLFQSCGENGVYYENSKNLNAGWQVKDTIKFNFTEKQKLIGFHNMYFILRNNNEYPYRNIYLLTKLKTPNGKEKVDTLEYQLAAASGEWLGDGMGSVKQNKLMYKNQISFRDSGDYQLEIVHGMRDEILKGIEGISLLIDKTKNDKE